MTPRQPEKLTGCQLPPEFPGQIRWSQIAASFLSIPGERRFGFNGPPLTRLVGNLLDAEPDCIGY